ncbi:hypothetical protein ABT160_04425 [Streptomyces sp. NPDC001941]|uniref:hypothetical protein n=1 Tax=Streptomyces sp. NPDC001941 TaxID=3154659 RepID=UPI00332986EC
MGLYVLVQRSRHTRAYVQIPNEIARHSRLSLEAVGLLTHLLSLPDTNGATVERITSSVPNGRTAVGRAMRELVSLGYVTRARVQDPETGRWVTLTSVTDNPSDTSPTVGDPTPRTVGGYPKEKDPKGNDLPQPSVIEAEAREGLAEKEEGEFPEEEKTATATDSVTVRATACLGRLGNERPSLALSVRESVRLAPLAARWFEDGLTEADVTTALTRALPRSVESAAALVSYRLQNHQPEKASSLRLAPSPAPVREQCPECDRPYPAGHSGGLCRDCREDA